MKNYRITVNGTAYDVAVEELGAGAAPVAAAPAAPVAAAAPWFAVYLQQPVRVLPEKGRVFFAHKGRKP